MLAGIISGFGARGYSQNSLDPDKRAPAYAPVREADVMWMKRIWRRIDLRQKMNHAFYFPERPSDGRKSFFEYLKAAVMEGAIVAYDPGPLGDDDGFTKPFSRAEVAKLLTARDTVFTPDLENPDLMLAQEIDMSVKSSDIIQYEIKEDWFFDRQRSVMEVRIVGICPLLMIRDEATGEFRGYKRLFWIDMNTARTEMAKWPVFNRWNDFEQRSYDEVFRKRQFASYIIKESNVYDRYVREYKQGEDALLEADEIEKRLLTMEHDLWSY